VCLLGGRIDARRKSGQTAEKDRGFGFPALWAAAMAHFCAPDQPKVAFEGLAVLPRRMADQTGRASLPGPFPDDQTGHPSADPQGSAAGEHLRDDSAGALSLLASPQP